MPIYIDRGIWARNNNKSSVSFSAKEEVHICGLLGWNDTAATKSILNSLYRPMWYV